MRLDISALKLHVLATVVKFYLTCFSNDHSFSPVQMQILKIHNVEFACYADEIRNLVNVVFLGDIGTLGKTALWSYHQYTHLPMLQCCERDILALLVVMRWVGDGGVGGAGIAYQWELPTRHCCSYHQYPLVPTLWSSACYYHN